jgi:hypothetical protein
LPISIVQALRHIRQIAHESSGEMPYGGGRQPAVLRTFSQRLSRFVAMFLCFSSFMLFSFMSTNNYAILTSLHNAEASMTLLMDFRMMVGH